jgi:hypothetical protein
MLKLLALVALFAGLCWFGTQVTLGSQTLFGHLYAIAGTKESQDLFEGTRESAKPLVDDVRRRIAGAADPKSSGGRADAGATAAEDPGETARQTTPKAAPQAAPDSAPRAGSHGAPRTQPHEELTPADRHRLRRLISSAEGAAARP